MLKMGKNAHPPRNKSASKPKPVNQSKEDDTSFIVFSNSDKPRKKTPINDDLEASNKTAKGGADGSNTDAGPSTAPKPDVRTLIGGASWTGKLPVTLLSEHCQKQKWERPEYTMTTTHEPKGFLSGVILRQKNTKTQEMTTLAPMRLPKDRESAGIRETALEARHLAATYALYRIASGKNLHMMMPPQFRDLWKGDFADMKKEADGQGYGWLYEADPFAAKFRKDEERRLAEKKHVERQRKMEADKKAQADSPVPRTKGWARAPKVDMGQRMRRDVEALVRSRGVWNPHGVSLAPAQATALAAEISALGFRKSHAEEAIETCASKEEALEWLLIHVPEDDLPKWTMPDNYAAGVSLASNDLVREGKVKRLSRTGFAPELCFEALEACAQDEQQAAENLQNRLVPQPESWTDEVDEHVWDDELPALVSIYGDRLVQTPSDTESLKILLAIQGDTKYDMTLHIRKTKSYPSTLPVISLESLLPAYIRLSILRQCLQHCTTLVGGQMVFDLVDWLETEVPNVVANPGKLGAITSALGVVERETEFAQVKRRAHKARPRPIDLRPSPAGQKLRAEWQTKQATAQQQRMLQARQNLPAWKHCDEIVEAVARSQVTIISGETGSGKSTQSIQFILDDMIQNDLGIAANIICTQPRRISALGLADRVADERCSKVGDEIGYAIRGESRSRPGVTRATFVTTGILMRRLQTSGGQANDLVDALADVSHIVIDEVHERGLDTDLLMALLKSVLAARKTLKLILMSATLDADIFEQYFKESAGVARIEIAGRTHPVTDVYIDDIVRMTGYGGFDIEDDNDATADATPSLGVALRAVGTRINYDLIAQTVECIDMELGTDPGGILIFLPGVAEIDRTLRSLQGLPQVHALPLHASLQPQEQRKVFLPARAGKRKVIAATNVAETSITIEDIVAVIDTGRVKETSYDAITNMVRLEEVWASRAACKQRRGRAGRVREGTCYKLYTKTAETVKMAERPEPEIRRVPLDQLCLSVKAMGIADVGRFLAGTLTPPESLAVEGALEIITRMGALESNELTALGKHLAMIPADLRCGKLLVYGATFGCLDECLTMASVLSARSPFLSPPTAREEAKAARAAFSDGSGDLLCDLHAYEAWSARRHGGDNYASIRRWCEANFLSNQTLEDISSNRKQYIASLQDIGFMPTGSRQTSTKGTSGALLRALIAASFTPQVARIEFPDTKYVASVSGSVAQDAEARAIKFFAEDNTAGSETKPSRVFIHPSSTLFTAQTFPGNAQFLAYFTKMATSKVFVRELTPFNTFSTLLFCGKLELSTQHSGLLVDGWIRIRGWARIGVLVSRLRVMLDELLAKKIDDPGLDIGGSHVVSLVQRLIELDGLDR